MAMSRHDAQDVHTPDWHDSAWKEGWAHSGWWMRRAPNDALFLGVNYHRQGDYWLVLTLLRGDTFVELAPRLREPNAGGGNTMAIFNAVRQLGTALSQTHTDQLELPLNYPRPFKRKPLVSRHMDEGWGELAMTIEPQGTLVLGLIPEDNTYSSHGDASLWVSFPYASTPYPVYRALGQLYTSIQQDNKRRPGYLGNHG